LEGEGWGFWEGGGEGEDGREFGKLCVGCIPHFHGVGIGVNNVFKVGGESSAVDCGARAREADALGDVEDDGCEAVSVEVDFLVVGDLADCAENVSVC
jgi:hypothetical protein